MTPSQTRVVGFWPAWRGAARRAPVHEALRQLYDSLEEAASRRGARCLLSGRCCHFEAYDHRLYVTGLEVAWVLNQEAPPQPVVSGHACPYQLQGRCSVHASRPLGCRIFFCQEGTAAWQHELYERKLDQLRAIHDQYGIDYRYMEWLGALKDALGSGCFEPAPGS